MSKRKRIYIAATRQNDGKTIASIGIIHSVLKRMDKIGYIKPVGQHYVEVNSNKVDEDAILVKETYSLDCRLPDMSPVAVPHGFTRSYIENPDRDRIKKQITDAYARVSEGKDFTLIEGTGHAGVGSVFDMSNADVAKMLNAKVVLVTAGGIGRPIDEIILNKALFDSIGVEVLGVIINKVNADKYDEIEPIVRKGLGRKGLEVLGVMPYIPVLSNPTIEQILEDIEGKLLTGEGHLKTTVNRTVIGAMPPHEALGYLDSDTLLITPGSRDDLILAAMSTCIPGAEKEACVAGIVLTGKVQPDKRIMRLVNLVHIPVIDVPYDTFTAAKKINSIMVKLHPGDTSKIEAAENLVSEHVDIDRLLNMIADT